MSILDLVREKYKTPMHETCKSSRRASAGSAGPQDRDSEIFSGMNLAGLSLDDLRTTAGDDWEHIAADRLRLKDFARAVKATRQRQAGIVPGHYTSTTDCRGCGVVPIWEGAPEVVDGCPWCLNRKRGLRIPAARSKAMNRRMVR